MRNLLLILCAVFLISCDKKDQTDPQTKGNTFSMKNNGITYNGTTQAELHNPSDTLNLYFMVDQPNEAVLFVFLKFNGVGTYNLTQNQAGYYTTVGRDVILSDYKLLPGSIGKLIISKYDAEKKQIAGSFNLDLKLTNSYSGQDADTLYITDGNFTGAFGN